MTTDEDVIRKYVVEYRNPAELIPYENNAKRHPPEQVKKIAASIKEHGWSPSSIEITPAGVVINGHGRRLAAIELGLTRVPVVVRHDLTTDAQIRKYRLDDNKVAESELDTEILTAELNYLNKEGVDLTGTFDIRELEMALEDLGDIDVDALVADIGDQVEEHSSETKERLESEGSRDYQITKVLGFTKVTGEQRRDISLLQTHAESVTGKEGAEALAEFAKSVVSQS